jgi:hypothetical protein
MFHQVPSPTSLSMKDICIHFKIEGSQSKMNLVLRSLRTNEIEAGPTAVYSGMEEILFKIFPND